MSAGLEASTATPGSTPPVSSVITVGRDGRTGEALRRPGPALLTGSRRGPMESSRNRISQTDRGHSANQWGPGLGPHKRHKRVLVTRETPKVGSTKAP